MKTRKYDVALAIGAVLACAAAGTAGLAIGIHTQPMIIQATADYMAKTALMSAEDLAAERSQAILLTSVAAVAAVILIIAITAMTVYYRRSMGNTHEAAKPAEKPKGPWATGVSVEVGVGCMIGGIVVSGLTAFYVGAYVEQLNNAALIEPLSIAAGVTGGLALVCFAVDYFLNNREPAQAL